MVSSAALQPWVLQKFDSSELPVQGRPPNVSVQAMSTKHELQRFEKNKVL